MDDKCTDMNNLKQERQSLLGLIRSLKSDTEDLRRQISGHKKTNQDKVTTLQLHRIWLYYDFLRCH